MSAPLTAEDVWKLFAETDRRFQETERLLKEESLKTERMFQETERLLKEASLKTDRLLKEESLKTDRRIKELGRQIGGLGNKFGSFAEGLALPSMERLLRQRFGMTVVSPRVKVQSEDEEIEIDVLAYANGAINSVYLVEVKSHLDERAIQQTLALLERFPRLFPEHRDKALYGILACIHGSKELRRRVLDEGLYLASIHDEQFRLETPKDFMPRRFNAAPSYEERP